MSNQKQNNRPRGPMGHGMRGGGEKAKDFKGTMKKLFNYIKPYSNWNYLCRCLRMYYGHWT